MDKIVDFYKEWTERATTGELIAILISGIKNNAEIAGITGEHIIKLLDIIEHQEQRINRLYDIVYQLAPDLEIIQILSKTEEDQQELINKYMNHGEYTI